MTVHITAKKEEISSVVLMPGDPLRAKFIAENYLKDYKLVNSVRNMLIYTGLYMNKKITVASSGMGMASMGIYSYELYKFYNVETIIRVGSAGSMDANVYLNDIINVASCYSESTFAKVAFNMKDKVLLPSKDVYDFIDLTAKNLSIPIKTGRIHSSDVFYQQKKGYWKKLHKKFQLICEENESFALFANARSLKKKAASILTISDSKVVKKAITPEERQTGFNKMIQLGLEIACSL